jgi:hypothetical protein
MNFIDKVEEVLREEWENNNGELKIEGDWTVGLDRLEACWEREKNYVADFSEWVEMKLVGQKNNEWGAEFPFEFIEWDVSEYDEVSKFELSISKEMYEQFVGETITDEKWEAVIGAASANAFIEDILIDLRDIETDIFDEEM